MNGLGLSYQDFIAVCRKFCSVPKWWHHIVVGQFATVSGNLAVSIFKAKWLNNCMNQSNRESTIKVLSHQTLFHLDKIIFMRLFSLSHPSVFTNSFWKRKKKTSSERGMIYDISFFGPTSTNHTMVFPSALWPGTINISAGLLFSHLVMSGGRHVLQNVSSSAPPEHCVIIKG